MSKKFNNKILLAIFAGLIILLVVVKWYQKTRSENTLNTEIVTFDTAKVTKVELYPSSYKGEVISFIKEKSAWKITNSKIKVDPDPQAVSNILNTLKEIKPQRLASKDKKKWAEFQVTDTSATRVKVFTGNDLALDLLIGKFSYKQGRDPYAQYGGGVTGTSFVRVKGEDEVYAVDGFLTFSFNQGFNTFRNQALSRIDKVSINKFTVKFPGDSSYIAEKKDGKWLVNNQHADSTKIDQYLNTISYKSASSFNDNYKPAGMPASQLIIETNDKKSITIDAYLIGEKQWVINSTFNPSSWFNAGSGDLYEEIFKGPGAFKETLAKKKK